MEAAAAALLKVSRQGGGAGTVTVWGSTVTAPPPPSKKAAAALRPVSAEVGEGRYHLSWKWTCDTIHQQGGWLQSWVECCSPGDGGPGAPPGFSSSTCSGDCKSRLLVLRQPHPHPACAHSPPPPPSSPSAAEATRLQPTLTRGVVSQLQLGAEQSLEQLTKAALMVQAEKIPAWPRLSGWSK